ncbi:MAG TPA: tripartite tricarboxylate transporter substrate binding protein [Eoetvoesiella sp.]
MKKHKVSVLTLTLACMGLFSIVTPSIAADEASNFPNRAVTIVSPFAAGGATDVLARLVAHRLGEIWKQSVVVENKAGAGGVIATAAVANSKADGYTLLLGSVGPIEVLPSLLKELPYDPEKDLDAVSMLVNVENVLVVNNAVPAKSVKELIELAKKDPGSLNFGSSGIGTTGHLAGEVFKQQANVDMLHVPYRGGAPAANALLAGDVQLSFATVPSVVGHINAGKLRPLAVTGSEPLSALPGVPPIKDEGVPDYRIASWYGLLAPDGTPPAVISKIHADVQQVLAMPDVKTTLLEQGWTTVSASVEQMQNNISSGIKEWKVVLERAGIQPR